MIVNEIYILEWYDNIITAIICSDDKCFLSNCININSKNHEVTYYNIEVTKEEVSCYFSKKNYKIEDWILLNLIFKKNNIEEKCTQFTTKLLEIGVDINMHPVANKNIKVIKFPFDIASMYF